MTTTRTHCKNGHQLIGNNVYTTTAGRVRCVQCRRDGSTRWRRNQGMGERVSDPLVRFAAKYEVDASGCWFWTAGIDAEGYARFSAGSHALAHRFAYDQFVGPIPAGFTVDHLCHNEDASCPGGVSCPHRRCVNPEHLRAVSPAENALSSSRTTAAKNKAKTHCRRGHEFTDENTRVRPDGGRSCRQCEKDRHSTEEYRRKKAEQNRKWAAENRDKVAGYARKYRQKRRFTAP